MHGVIRTSILAIRAQAHWFAIGYVTASRQRTRVNYYFRILQTEITRIVINKPGILQTLTIKPDRDGFYQRLMTYSISIEKRRQLSPNLAQGQFNYRLRHYWNENSFICNFKCITNITTSAYINEISITIK